MHLDCILLKAKSDRGYGLVAYTNEKSGLQKTGFVCCVIKEGEQIVFQNQTLKVKVIKQKAIEPAKERPPEVMCKLCKKVRKKDDPLKFVAVVSQQVVKDFVHSVCAQMESLMSNTDSPCSECGKKEGMKINCSEAHCIKVFHGSCGIRSSEILIDPNMGRN